jgi:hypothetical protein
MEGQFVTTEILTQQLTRFTHNEYVSCERWTWCPLYGASVQDIKDGPGSKESHNPDWYEKKQSS